MARAGQVHSVKNLGPWPADSTPCNLGAVGGVTVRGYVLGHNLDVLRSPLSLELHVSRQDRFHSAFLLFSEILCSGQGTRKKRSKNAQRDAGDWVPKGATICETRDLQPRTEAQVVPGSLCIVGPGSSQASG